MVELAVKSGINPRTGQPYHWLHGWIPRVGKSAPIRGTQLKGEPSHAAGFIKTNPASGKHQAFLPKGEMSGPEYQNPGTPTMMLQNRRKQALKAGAKPVPDEKLAAARQQIRDNAARRKAQAAPKPVEFPELYHASSSHESIQKNGFADPGKGDNGAFFGRGTYFHTRKSDADEALTGYQAFIDPSMQQVRASATVNKPFRVEAKDSDKSPRDLMQRHMEAAGFAKPGEKLTPDEITRRLQAHGYDSVEIRQNRANSEIDGNQLVVFDPKKQARVAAPAAKKTVAPKVRKALTRDFEKTSASMTPGDRLAERHNSFGQGVFAARKEDVDKVLGEASKFRTADKGVELSGRSRREQAAIRWLADNGYLKHTDNQYALTSKGKELFG